MGHAGRARSLGAKAVDLVLFVFLEVAFKPEPLPFFHVAFPREDVGAGAVKEPTVVGDHNGAAGEFLQGVFQGGKGFHVEVVGGLVEEDEVATLFEGEREVEAVAFTTGENLGGFLLVGTFEAEG